MRYALTNPATGEVELTVPDLTDEGLADAVTAAHAAHTVLTAYDVVERARLVDRVADLHTERRAELADLIVREMGKPLAQALGEVDFTADIYRYYAEHAASLMADEKITLAGGSGTAVLRRSSLGVLLGIMPWNFPAYQVARFAAPNLVIGNTVLLKHAEQCPASSAAIETIFHDAGLPVGAYVNLYATHAQIETVIADPRVQGVSLTGSERAGAAVAAVAGRHLKKVVLELGGSDPFLLLSTDDLDATVAAAVAARVDNNGQACNAAKRFVVLDELYDDFLAAFTATMTAVRVGDPRDDATELGPLSSERAAETLAAQVDRAVAQGAVCRLGGVRRGAWFPPTILTGVTAACDAYHEELFGPVAQVFSVPDEQAAVALANDTPYGLGSYVFTTDPEQARRVADALQAGMVFVNVVGADAPELPFGGIKRSGSGRELGRLGADEFVNKKVVRVG